jgi:hypothetical protein
MKNNLLQTALADALDELTPDERAAVAQGTAKQWAQAITELAADPTFWGDVAKAFLAGLTQSR